MGYCIDRYYAEGMLLPIGNPKERQKACRFFISLAKAIRRNVREHWRSDCYDDAKEEIRLLALDLTEYGDEYKDNLNRIQRILRAWDSPFVIDEYDGKLVFEYDFDSGGKWDGDAEEAFIDAFAPFAEEGAYAGFVGEDQEMWSYVYDGHGKWRLHKPTIDWTGAAAPDPKLLWNALLAHRGHNVEIASYGDRNDIRSVTLEDLDTNEVILDAELYTLVARDDA